MESAADIKTTGSSLTAALRGYGGATSQTTFTFVNPEVLRVVVDAGQALSVDGHTETLMARD